jgi:hypothetical protein
MVHYAAARSPLPRPIRPEEVAVAAAFRCSPLASGITGEGLFVGRGRREVGKKLDIDQCLGTLSLVHSGVDSCSSQTRFRTPSVCHKGTP